MRRAPLVLPLALAACGGGDAQTATQKGAFPKGFLFGTASAAYQVEGTYEPGGERVSSNWSEWEDMGKVANGQKNDRGTDFYNRYAKDFDLAKQLGTNAYRLGIEWARIEPTQGQFDDAAFQHYRDQIQSARDHGLTPVVTLYHWVVPPWVQSPKDGTDLVSQAPGIQPGMDGSRTLRSAFSDAMQPFVEQAGKRLGDLVDIWVVLNEPWSVEVAGYWVGVHPPGKLLDFAGSRNAGINFAITHAAAYDTLHRVDTIDADGDGVAALVGSTMVGSNAKADPADPDGAGAVERYSYFTNDWLMNAWSAGALDMNLDGDISDSDGVVPEGTYLQLAGRLDYVAFNYYAPTWVTSCSKLASSLSGDSATVFKNVAALPLRQGPPELPHSENGAEIDADSFLATIRLFDRYTQNHNIPMLILENGISDCADAQRSRYLVEHVDAVKRAIDEGIPMRGYMVWSLTDNFEWTDATSQCFGLYRVDYAADFARSPTKAVDVYRQIASARRLDPALLAKTTADPYPTDCRPGNAAQQKACIAAEKPVMDTTDALVRQLCQ